MAKQIGHIRKINNINIFAGKGKKDYLVGKLVWYKRKVYQVKKIDSNGKYTLVNNTARLMVNGVPKIKLKLYK